jgi:hypothetical protein
MSVVHKKGRCRVSSTAIAPFEEGKWILVYVKDPDGNWIELGSCLRKKK